MKVMKRIKNLSTLLLLIVTFGFISCDTEPVDPVFLDYEPEVEEPASFKVSFGGDTYVASTTAVVMENGVTTISAVRANDGAVFTLVVPGTTAGTYNTSVIAYAPGTSGNQYINMNGTEISGSVTLAGISTTNNTISGTFSFTGYWSDASENLPSVEFTNGIFINLPFTSDTDPDPTPGDASFSVNIDGEEYIADEYGATIGNGLISIGGTRGTTGEYVGISLNATAIGTYNGDDAFLAYSPDGDEDNVYINIDMLGGGASNGQVTITQIDQENQTISGTFSFTGYLADESKSFTEGEFTNIPYTTGVGIDESELTAEIDGVYVDYVDDIIVAYANDQITINGIGADHKISLFIGTLGVGTYPITGGFGAPSATYTDENDIDYNAVEGTVTITEKADGWVSGTFEYTTQDEAGNNVHQVTSGTFNVEY